MTTNTCADVPAMLRAPLAFIGAAANGAPPENRDERHQTATDRASHASPEQARGGHDASPDGMLLRHANVRSVRREDRLHPVTKEIRRLVVADWVASTESVDSYESILICDWDKNGGLDQFRRNPVFLWAHDRALGHSMPAIGHCENARVEQNQLLLTTICDDTTEFDRQIAEKIEKGVIRMGSVGFDWSKAELRTIGDQEVVVFSGNRLREFSGCNIGSNNDAMVQRALVSASRELARAHGSVDMAAVVAHLRAANTTARADPPAAAPPAVASAVPPAPIGAPAAPTPKRHGDPMATKKTIDIEERAVRADQNGATIAIVCPHCEAPVDANVRTLPVPAHVTAEHEQTRKALDTARADLAAEKTRVAEMDGKLTRAEAEKTAAENRAAALDVKVATMETTLRAQREAFVASEIDKRVGVRIEVIEREDQIRLAMLDLADATPDPEKAGHTLGDKAFAARLAKLDQRRDLGLLGAPITGPTNVTTTPTPAAPGTRSLWDEAVQN